jgi:hypothetical protein
VAARVFAYHEAGERENLGQRHSLILHLSLAGITVEERRGCRALNYSAIIACARSARSPLCPVVRLLAAVVKRPGENTVSARNAQIVLGNI